MKNKKRIEFPQFLAFIMLLGLSGCISNGKKELTEKEINTPIKEVLIEKKDSEVKIKDIANTKIWESKDIVPQRVLAYLDINLPGWNIPDTSEYVSYWWAFNDRSDISYFVNTDLNMDGKEDYAITMKTAGMLKLVFVLTNGDSLSHWVANDFCKTYNGIGLKYGIYLKKPGRTDCVVNNQNISLILEQNAIALFEEEIMIRIYYWEEGVFKIFNTK